MVTRSPWPVNGRPVMHIHAVNTEQGITLGGSQACALPFPPPLGKKITTLIKPFDLSSGSQPLLILRQEFGLFDGVAIFCNCFIFQVADGLAVYSPISLTEEAQRLFDEALRLLSPLQVKHVVCPSLSPEHWIAAEQAYARWPDATYWVTPGATDRSNMVGTLLVNGPEMWERMVKRGASVRVIEEGHCPELGEEVGFVVFRGPAGFTEVSCFLPKYRSVILCDLAFNRSEPELRGDGLLGSLLSFSNELAGIQGKLGSPFGLLTMSVARDEGQRWLGRVMGWIGWDDVYCLHMSPITENGREEVKRAFEFLK